MAVRLQNTELVLPVIVGTVAIHLGKKVCLNASATAHTSFLPAT
jgi:hypothetical protein